MAPHAGEVFPPRGASEHRGNPYFTIGKRMAGACTSKVTMGNPAVNRSCAQVKLHLSAPCRSS